jgi:hypothetical protein
MFFPFFSSISRRPPPKKRGLASALRAARADEATCCVTSTARARRQTSWRTCWAHWMRQAGPTPGCEWFITFISVGDSMQSIIGAYYDD